MTKTTIALSILLALNGQNTGPGWKQLPAIAKTPTECLTSLRTTIANERKQQQTAGSSSVDQKVFAAACTSRFELNTTAAAELTSLIELYSLAGEGERMTAAVDRALSAKELNGHDRAAV